MSDIRSSKGFTLIELLVVIAIIGILSSVVLASLSTARNKGKAASVKSGLASLRTQMEVAANGGPYGTGVVGVGDDACDFAGATYLTDTAAANIIINIKGSLSAATNLFCSVDQTPGATKFAAAATLPDGSGVQCIDSSGNNKITPSIVAPVAGQINNGACI